MKTIYNFTNIASHYRSLLWEKLLKSKEFDFHFLFGKNKGMQIKEIDFDKPEFAENRHKLHRLKNIWIGNRILVWQAGVIYRVVFHKMNMAIFLGEVQVLSTWIAMLLCKLRGIPVVYWTHGVYGNEPFFKKKIRLFFYSTADYLLLYERRAKKLLIKEGIKEDRLKVIYNSLDYDLHLKIRSQIKDKKSGEMSFFEDNSLPYLIFIGRLTEVKRLDLLIDAVAKINSKEAKVNLLIIGKGEALDALKKQVQKLSLEDCVHFYGACYDQVELAELIYNAELCVSPGNVGLTAIHALSFGTPVCTHANFSNQMPEVEVVEENVTGCFFEENNLESLSESINNWIHLEVDRDEIRKNSYRVIDENYNPYYQLEVINNLING